MHDYLAEQFVASAQELSRRVEELSFGLPVTHTYNPLSYASRAHHAYIRRFAASRKRVIFWGMNPGPWGMAQTGVPFGEVAIVRDWMGIHESIGRPERPHPKRPIEGFSCKRSEVSGRRLWGLMRSRFVTPERFFAEHFVANYCPLVFMESSGRNRTPNKLSAEERIPLYEACDDHVRAVVELLDPLWVIGVGKFAQGRLSAALGTGVKIGTVLHPSPASPLANRGWEEAASRELTALGVW
ncbi:MAG TPA: uracil-DNA glycosylase family protein [Spirochaetia bacterium]|nr:uracil-DNA glycosylase family protein [Spirochaetia bacterium]